MDKDTVPPPNNNESVDIIDLLKPEQIQLLVRLLTEVIGDSGYGKVTIAVYNKSIVGMDTAKTYRRGDENNSSRAR
jgi:hypothetical protein